MTYSADLLATTPRLFYKFDESSGLTSADSSGNSGTGLSWGGTPTWGGASSTPNDSATSVSGFTTTIRASPTSALNVLAPSTAYSFIVPVKTSGSARATIASAVRGGQQYVFGFTAAGKVFLEHYVTGPTLVTVTGATTVNDGQWHLVGCRWNGSNIQVFVNGLPDATAVTAASISGNTGPQPYIGVTRTGSSSFADPWTGSLHLLGAHVDANALTDTEFSDLFDSWSPPPSGEGAITAPLPSVTGTGVVTITGSGTSTAPTPTAAGTGESGQVTGSGVVTVPMPTAAGTGDSGVSLVCEHLSTDAAHNLAFSTNFTIGHSGDATHDVLDFSSTTSLFLTHSSDDSFHETVIQRPPVVVDPETGKAPYQLLLVERDGTVITELTGVKVERYWQDLNTGSTLEFTLPSADDSITQLMIPTREVQFWRAGVLEDWLVLVRPRSHVSTVTYIAVSLHFYFEHRVIGKVPRPNLLKNGSFEEGERYWNFTWVEGSIPTAAPVHSIVGTTLNGDRALRIEGSSAVQYITTTLEGDVAFAFDSANLTSSGISAIDALCAAIPVPNPTIRCEGHTDSISSSAYNYQLGLDRANSVKARILFNKPSAVVTAVSYGETRPKATNSTSAGRALNRRVEIEYAYTQTAKGHRQYAGQSFPYVNPTAKKKKMLLTLVGWLNITQYLGNSKDGWGVYMQLMDPSSTSKKPVATANVPINVETPRNRWTRMECSLEVPADGKTYRVDVRLYPPEGVCIWDEISVTAADQLAFFDVDQALIVKGTVEHAQDPAMGKSDLNIDTLTPLTGQVRTREYPWVERKYISECLNEWPTLADGMDLTFDFTPTTRTLHTHYPRKARNTGYTFALGGNLAAYTADIDGTQTVSQVIVQAEGEGSDREEGTWTDTSQVGGLILEKVYNATPGSSISSLTMQAKRGIWRWARPIIMPTLTMHPDATDELLNAVTLGDVVRVQIDDGWLTIDSDYRIVGRGIDVDRDQMTYAIAPEYRLT